MRILFCFVFISLIVLCLPEFEAQAQESPVITAETINQLRSVAKFDFELLETAPISANFALNEDSSRVLIVDQARGVVLLDDTGTIRNRFMVQQDPTSFVTISATDFAAEHFLIVATEGETVTLHLGQDDEIMQQIALSTRDIPNNAWLDCVNDDCTVWLEMIPTDFTQNTQIVRVPLPERAGDSIIEYANLERLPYGPALDETAIVRIGRIPPPYAVTSDENGLVKLWDLRTGEVIREATTGTGQAAVFGALNTAATHLLWRDDFNETLYLLDLEADVNREVDTLNGAYAQWYFLNADVSLALAVNFDFEEAVFSWNLASGERENLGAYRSCTLPQPDLAQLSADGTTLLIGCDAGLEWWRVTRAE